MYHGKAPFRAKLEKSTKQVASDNFIGYLRMKDAKNPLDTNDFEFMYFRDYTLDENNKPVFEDFEPQENMAYFFDMCFMRIPPEFEYLVTNKDKNAFFYHKQHNKKEQYYYGLTLLNIHPDLSGTTLKPGTTLSIAAKIFIEPNKHYDTKDYGDKLLEDDINFGVGVTDPGGAKGCIPFASFGIDKVPLFRLPLIDNNYAYFMLTVGTEATVGFCEFLDEADMTYLVDKFYLLASSPLPGYKLGIALFEYLRYETGISKSKYGVHIVPVNRVDKKRPWGIGWFEPIPY